MTSPHNRILGAGASSRGVVTALGDIIEVILGDAPAPVAVFDTEFRYLYVNAALAAWKGVSQDAHVGRTIAEVSPGIEPIVLPLLERALGGEKVVDREVRMPSMPGGGGEQHWLSTILPVRDGDRIVALGVFATDVTGRRSAERQLDMRTALYELLVGANRAAARCETVEELFREVCDLAVTIGMLRFAWIGVPEDGIVRPVASAGRDDGYLDTITVTLDGDDPRSWGPVGRSLRSGRPVVVNDFQTSVMTSPWHGPGAEFGFASSAAFPVVEGDAVVAVLALYSEVPGFFNEELVATLAELTPSLSFALDRFARERERRRTQEALLLRDRAIHAVSQGIIISDARLPGVPITFASPGFERLTQYTQEEVVGHTCYILVGERTDLDAVERIRATYDAGVSCAEELLTYRKDGTPFWNSVVVTPVSDASGEVTHFVEVHADVTERRHLEDQFRQAHKMEAVGRLAGGVAHDFNNILTVILGCSELLLAQSTAESPEHELAVEVFQAAERATVLTQQLLAFSREQSLEPKLEDVNAIIGGIGQMLLRLLGEDVTLATELTDGLGPVRVDQGQIEQLLVNLAINARDAMPRGGVLRIVTSAAELGETAATALGGLSAGSYILLEVSDSGSGMDELTRSRVFEPFFTTKEEGRGTGLGLSTVHGIVRQAGGAIELATDLGRGTTFSIFLPVADASGMPISPLPDPAGERMPSGSETVLLVEDDDAVRSFGLSVLHACGYAVLAAGNGQEALRIALDHPGPIHLLVSDVVMPRLGGRELAARFGELRPGCRILLLSGYGDDAVDTHALAGREYDFLRKPFTPTVLAAAVRRILDRV